MQTNPEKERLESEKKKLEKKLKDLKPDAPMSQRIQKRKFDDAFGEKKRAAKPKKKLPPKPKLVKKMKQPNLKAYFKKK